MTSEQLTLFEYEPPPQPSPWLEEDGADCHHQWLDSHDQHGLFCYRCFHCRERRGADPFLDRGKLKAYAEKRKEQYLKALYNWQTATTKNKEKTWRESAHQLYWVTKLSFLRVGILDWGAGKEIEQSFPLPPELIDIYQSLTEDNTNNQVSEELLEISQQSKEKCTRGFQAQITKTPSTKTPSTRPQRKHSQGTGSIFKSQCKRGDKTYHQWWFQYETVTDDGKRKKRSLYIPKKKLDQIKQLNEGKQPISVILDAIRNTI